MSLPSPLEMLMMLEEEEEEERRRQMSVAERTRPDDALRAMSEKWQRRRDNPYEVLYDR